MALFAASPTGLMSCSGSGADPEAAPASAASAPGPAPVVSAPPALPAGTAAENKASPAGTAGGPGAGAAAGGTGPVAARAGEPAERRGAGEGVGSALGRHYWRGRAAGGIRQTYLGPCAFHFRVSVCWFSSSCCVGGRRGAPRGGHV